MRAAKNNPNVQVVAVNDPFIPLDYMKYSECRTSGRPAQRGTPARHARARA